MIRSTKRVAGLALACLFAAPAGAAPANGAVSVDASGLPIVRVAPGARAGDAMSATSPWERLPTSRTVVYDNFLPVVGARYDCCLGYLASGPDSSEGSYETAMAFTPAIDTRIRVLRLPLFNFSGAESADVALQDDDHGVPGRVVAQFQVDVMSAFGGCCQTQVVRGSGYPVRAGHTYWVVVRASGAAMVAWDQNITHTTGTMAVNFNGGGWQVIPGVNVAAFAIAGH